VWGLKFHDVMRRFRFADSQPPRRKWVTLLRWLLLVSLIPVSVGIYRYGFWISYLILTGPLGGSEIVAIDTSCGDGEYRIVVHQYKSGDGYLELTNRQGKVFDSSKFSRGGDYTPFRWKRNYRKVMVGLDDGLAYLEVK
jgi:hypothetical protein